MAFIFNLPEKASKTEFLQGVQFYAICLAFSDWKCKLHK